MAMDVNERHEEVITRLVRIETQNEGIIASLVKGDDRMNDHGRRLRTVERKLFGIWIIGGAAVALVAAKIKGLIGGG